MSLIEPPSSDLRDLLDRHTAFWRRTNTRPLLHKIDFAGYNPKPYPVSSGRFLNEPTLITPADIHFDRLLGLDRPPKPSHTGSAINWLGPVYSEAWMESFIGCPIYAGSVSCTAKPCVTDIRAAAKNFSVTAAGNSPWASAAHQVLNKASIAARHKIAVRQLHLRGVIDMLAAYLGEEDLCLALYDHPAPLCELAWNFTELYLKIARRGLALRTPWHGGYVSVWNLFAPGPLIDYQIDASNMFPADLYARHFLSCDKAIIDAFDFSLIHLHACGLHLVEPLLALDKLKTVQISLDRETARTDLNEIVSAARRLQRAGKSLLIYGQLDDNELSMVTENLDPHGLAVFYWHPDKEKNE
jgi:hypothetical protein